jgi:uncharacterized protein DUF6247
MASPAAVPDPRVPPADPQAIRACLTPTLAAEFDHEWNTVLDRILAKAEQIQRTGHNPGAAQVDPQALIQQRLGR